MILALGASSWSQEKTWKELLQEGTAAANQFQNELAASTLVKALERAKAAGASPRDQAGIEHLLGVAELKLDRFRSAESHLRSAIALHLQAPEPSNDWLAQVRLHMAAVQTERRAFDDAEFTLCGVLEEELNTKLRLEGVLRLAIVAVRRNRYAAAAKLAKSMMPLVAALEPADRALGGEVFGNLGWLYLQFGDDETASRCVRHAQAAFRRTRNPAMLRAIGVHAELLRRSGRVDEFESMVQRTVDAFGPIVGEDHHELLGMCVSYAESLLDAGEVGAAQRQLAVIARRVSDRGRTWQRVARARVRVALARGETKAAREILQPVLEELRREDSGGLDAARAWLLHAQIESASGAHLRAVEDAHRAAGIFLRFGSASTESRTCIQECGGFRREAVAAGIDEAKLPPALKGLRRGDQIEPGWEKTDAAVQAALEKAYEALKARDWKRVLEHVEPVERLRPGEALAHYYRARALERSGKTADALAALDSAIVHASANARYYMLRAAFHSKLDRFDRMIVDATYALLLGADEGRCMFFRGLGRVGRREWELARASFARWRKAAPTDPRAMMWHGEMLMLLGRLEEAEVELLQAAGNERGELGARLVLARLYLRRGEPKRAWDECSAAVELSPDEPQALWLRARLHFNRRSWNLALHDMEHYEKTGADVSLHLWLYRWLCLRHTQGREGADAALREGMRGVGDDPLVRVAKTILGDGGLRDALAHYESDRDQLCAACFYLGAWREAEGDVDGAVTLFDRAIALKAKDADAFFAAKAARARLRR